MKPRALIVVMAGLLAGCAQTTTSMTLENSLRLTPETASHFARLAVKCIDKEFPNSPAHVVNSAQEVLGPKALHPSFYGCYDWHSSVHGHWMLVRLLRLFPSMPEANEIRTALNRNLTAENITLEAEYFKRPNVQSFERTYGWAWLLKLTEELQLSKDTDSAHWRENIRPLADLLAERYIGFLPKQTYAIRTGVHPNTAFGIGFALDYANTLGDRRLKDLLVERSINYYGNDTNYPAAWEPGGEDFLSPSLVEADLMRRVLEPAKFAEWFHRFLPDIAKGQPHNLLNIATVTDRTDPKLVHLDGLNLSRAWCMLHIANALPTNDPARKVLMDAANAHARDALDHVASGNYEGEHWLASFAVYLLAGS